MERESGISGGRALVLGAGGFLGAAWSLGALAAVQDATGWDAGNPDLVIGTSAGAVLAMMLRGGMSVDDLCAGQLGGRAVARATEPVTAIEARSATQLPDMGPPVLDLDGEPAWPTLPRPGLGSLPLLLRAARNPFRVRPAALGAALLPRGRRQLNRVGAAVDHVHNGRRWPTGTRIVATDYQTGKRTAFGRPGAPRVSPARATMASCAVPGWYAPVNVGLVPYVDGAVCSPSNADLARGCEEVWVLAPMASLHPGPLGRVQGWWRRWATERLMSEVRLLRASGARVHLLTPGARDLAAMGANMMDGRRRAQVLDVARSGVLARLGGARRRTGRRTGRAAVHRARLAGGASPAA
jgi:NTE family protein